VIVVSVAGAEFRAR